MPLAQPVSVPLINGVQWSFGHVTLRAVGLEFTGGIKSIKYSRKREREMLESNSPDPTGKSLGMNRYAASLELYLEWWRQTIRSIENTKGKGYGDQFFDAIVAYGNSPFDPFQDVIKGCTWDTTEADHSAGIPGLTRTVELNPLKILYDDREDLAFPLQPGG